MKQEEEDEFRKKLVKIKDGGAIKIDRGVQVGFKKKKGMNRKSSRACSGIGLAYHSWQLIWLLQ